MLEATAAMPGTFFFFLNEHLLCGLRGQAWKKEGAPLMS